MKPYTRARVYRFKKRILQIKITYTEFWSEKLNARYDTYLFSSYVQKTKQTLILEIFCLLLKTIFRFGLKKGQYFHKHQHEFSKSLILTWKKRDCNHPCHPALENVSIPSEFLSFLHAHYLLELKSQFWTQVSFAFKFYRLILYTFLTSRFYLPPAYLALSLLSLLLWYQFFGTHIFNFILSIWNATTDTPL